VLVHLHPPQDPDEEVAVKEALRPYFAHLCHIFRYFSTLSGGLAGGSLAFTMSSKDFNAFCTHIGVLKYQPKTDGGATSKMEEKELAKSKAKIRWKKAAAEVQQAKKQAEDAGEGDDYEEEGQFNKRVAKERVDEKEAEDKRRFALWQADQEARLEEERIAAEKAAAEAAENAVAVEAAGGSKEGEGKSSTVGEDGEEDKSRARQVSEAIDRVNETIDENIATAHELSATKSQSATALWLQKQAAKKDGVASKLMRGVMSRRILYGVPEVVQVVQPGFVATLSKVVVDQIFVAANGTSEEANPHDMKAVVGTRTKQVVEALNDDANLERFEFLEAVVRLAMVSYFDRPEEKESSDGANDNGNGCTCAQAIVKFVTEHVDRVYFKIEGDATLSTGPCLGSRRFRAQILYTTYTDAVMSCYQEELRKIFRRYAKVGGRSNSYPSIARAKAYDVQRGGRSEHAQTARDSRYTRYMRWAEWVQVLQLAGILPKGAGDDNKQEGAQEANTGSAVVTPRIAKLSFVFATMLVEDEMRTVNNTDPNAHAHVVRNAAQYATEDGHRRSRLLSFPDFLEALCRLVALLPHKVLVAESVVGEYAMDARRKRVPAKPHHVRLNSLLKLLVERLQDSNKSGGLGQVMMVNMMVARAQLKLLSAIRRKSMMSTTPLGLEGLRKTMSAPAMV
jgi:hypothetical protein